MKEVTSASSPPYKVGASNSAPHPVYESRWCNIFPAMLAGAARRSSQIIIVVIESSQTNVQNVFGGVCVAQRWLVVVPVD